MKIINSEQNIFFDVDNTLVMWNYNNNSDVLNFNYYGENVFLVPHKKHLSFLKSMKQRGFTVFVWSNNGYQWASNVIKTLNLEKYVDYVLSKPAKAVDDEKISDFIKTIYIPPDNI